MRKFGKISIRKIVPESGTQGESGNGGDQKKVVPESGTQGESGNGGDQKKVVPKSGTQRECRNRQRSEESCTGIRYAGKIPEMGSDRKKVVPKFGTSGRIWERRRSEESCTGIRYAERMREQAAIRRKLYRNPVRRENAGTGSDQKKVVPESGTQGESGNGGDQKKVVPKSGTQRECRNRQRSEESCTGIRYAERMREQAAIRRKLYRNPVRRENAGTGSDQKKVVPESGTQGESGNGGDQKKVVPKSGTQRECRNRQRSEESCTGIRYAGKIRKWTVIERKL